MANADGASKGTMRLAIPTLASLDIARSVDFYRHRLGFEEYARADDYARVTRDEVHIEFWPCADVEIPKNTSCRVQVGGIEELYAEYTAAKVIHPRAPLTERPWGIRDFSILDEDGNLITFFEPFGA
jgi:catechol 2,3-dioxygenase-like lactoylglutathione lyase family enzyme